MPPPRSEVLRRLTRGQRSAVAAITVLSVACAVVVLGSTAHLHFFGEVSTRRENTIASYAGRTGLWVLATPLCAWAILRGGRRAWAATVIWIALLVTATPWWWPGPDKGATEGPVWHTYGTPLLWLLVAAGTTLGLYAALRSGGPSVRWSAGAVAALIAIACGWTAHHLRVKNSELKAYTRCVPDAEGRRQLRRFRADALWQQLSATRTLEVYGRPRCRTAYGATGNTIVEQTLAAADQAVLFREAVGAAEATGWRLAETLCIPREPLNWRATFSKDIAVDHVRLEIEVAAYLRGLRVAMRVDSPIAGPRSRTDRCWETSR